MPPERDLQTPTATGEKQRLGECTGTWVVEDAGGLREGFGVGGGTEGRCTKSRQIQGITVKNAGGVNGKFESHARKPRQRETTIRGGGVLCGGSNGKIGPVGAGPPIFFKQNCWSRTGGFWLKKVGVGSQLSMKEKTIRGKGRTKPLVLGWEKLLGKTKKGPAASVGTKDPK